ncbi:MAG: hypothetical protein ACM3ZC_04055 [Bacteroidota bacterium]
MSQRILNAPEGFRAIDLGELQLRYRSETGDAGAATYTDTVTRAVSASGEVYRIELAEDTGKRTVALMQAGTLAPVRTEIIGADGHREVLLEYANGEALVDLPRRGVKRPVKAGAGYYDCSTLFHLFRAFPFGDGIEIRFNLVMDGRGGSPIGAFGMYVREIGREEIRTPAGAFASHKLEMGVASMPSLFAGKYKYFFWHTQEKPHYLVQYVDKFPGGRVELIAVCEPGRSYRV